jgi:hypothetical protein
VYPIAAVDSGKRADKEAIMGFSLIAMLVISAKYGTPLCRLF